MEMRKVGPAGLGEAATNRLLDLLTTDDAFRALFESNAKAALLQVGYEEPRASADGVSAQSWMCLQIKPGTSLASKESIREHRTKLASSLNAIHGFAVPRDLMEG